MSSNGGGHVDAMILLAADKGSQGTLVSLGMGRFPCQCSVYRGQSEVSPTHSLTLTLLSPGAGPTAGAGLGGPGVCPRQPFYGQQAVPAA